MKPYPRRYLLLIAEPTGKVVAVLYLVGLPPAGYGQRAETLLAEACEMHGPAKYLLFRASVP